jgi:hypothetical protein
MGGDLSGLPGAEAVLLFRRDIGIAKETGKIVSVMQGMHRPRLIGSAADMEDHARIHVHEPIK